MKKEIVKYSIFLMALLIATNQCLAADNNQLVKMDLDQTSEGAVKVNIYTDRPYNEQIMVNKKPDNKYVILLPETTNTMNVRPNYAGVSSVKNVDVKTQQYSSLPGKGYTKITIDSKKPIEVVPQAYVTRPVTPKRTVAEQTRRVMSQSSGPSLTPQHVQMAVPQRVLNQSRPATTSDFVPSYERRRQETQNYVAPAQTTRRQYTAPQQHYTPVQQVQRFIQQQPTQQVQQPVQSQSSLSQAVAVGENSALTQNEQVALEENNNNNNQAIDDATKQQLEANDDDISEDDLAFFKKIIRFKQKVIRKVKQILSVRISFSSVITVLQFILLIVLIKIIGDLVKRIQYPQTVETRPVTKRLIHDNDETFDQAYPSYSNMDVYNTSRSNFEEDNKEGFNIKPLSTPVSYKSRVDNLYSNQPKQEYYPQQQSYIQQQTYQQPQGYARSSESFYRPMSEINEEEKMSIFDENAADIEKSIFKNPLTPISKQAESRLFDDSEDPSVQNTPFPQDAYSINEENDKFFNYNNNQSDEDFFIFEDEEDDETPQYQEDYVDEDEEEYYDEDEEYVDEESEDEYEDEEVESDEIETQQAQAPVNPFEHLKVQSQYKIDDTHGFAHVNVDGINGLIGYVGSKVSVIRKFKEDVQEKMQVRLNEQPDANTSIYIVKIGQYKTLVEVKPDSIRQLLDL